MRTSAWLETPGGRACVSSRPVSEPA